MITEDYVSFETAQLLRDKGFNGSVNTFRSIDSFKKTLYLKDYLKNEERSLYIQVPTLQMAMKWLRDEYHLFIWISCKSGTSMPYYYEVFKTDKTKEYVVHIDHNVYGSYEKLCDDAIQYCLKNLI